MGKPIIPTLKHDNATNWEKAVNYIPPIGEIIVYDVDEQTTPPKIKIGDGKSKVNDLPFTGYTDFTVEDGLLTIL